MDYEQKYKEALKKAQKELQCCGDLDCAAARQIFRLFPELKESEDEKIRKEIIKLVKYYYGSSLALKHAVSKDEMLTWLEKQGKNKSAWSEKDEKIIETMCKEGDLKPSEMQWLKSLKDRVQPKPKQEWSENDEYQINTILHELDLKREIYKKEGNKVEEDRYNTQYNWLKSFKSNH